MKKIFLKIILVFYWLIILLVPTSCGFAQKSKLNVREKQNVQTATLLIKHFSTFQKESENLLSESLPSLFKIGLFENQFQWLKIVTDSSKLQGPNRYILNGNIHDFGNIIRIRTRITKPDKEVVHSQIYEIMPDSILSGFDRISSKIAWVIYKQIQTPIEREKLNILILPISSTGKDTTLKSFGERLSSSLETEFKGMEIVGKVERDQIKSNVGFDLIVNGKFTFTSDYDIKTNINIIDGETDKIVYTVLSYISAFDLYDLPDYVSNKFYNFFSVYKNIREDLQNLKSAKDFYKKGEKYQADISTQYAELKSEIMYNRALEVDSTYIPALIKNAQIARKNLEYELAQKLYSRALARDSLLTDAYIGLGEIFYEDYRDSLAIASFKKATRVARKQKDNKSLALANKNLGDLYVSSGNYDAAINYYQTAWQVDKDNINNWFNLANMHFSRYKDKADQISDTTDMHLAVKYFRDAMEKFPEDSTLDRNVSYLFNYWAKVYYDKYTEVLEDTSTSDKELDLLINLAYDKFKKAAVVTHYDTSLMAENYNYVAYIADQMLFDRETARRYSRQCIALNPDDEWSYRLFAFLHYEDKAFNDEAIRNIKKALKMEESAASYGIMGSAYQTATVFDSAWFAYKKSIDLRDEPPFYVIKGLVQSASASNNAQLIKQTVTYLNERLNAEPDNKSYLEWIIMLQKDLNRYDQVELVLNNYLNQQLSEDQTQWAYLKLAEAQREQKKFSEAIVSVNKCIAIDSNSKEAFALLDSLYFIDSQTAALDLKIETLEKNIETEKTWKNLYALGFAYVDKGEYEKGILQFKTAADISASLADTASVYYALGYAYYRRGAEIYDKKDTLKGKPDIILAEEYLTKASKLFPNWESPLSPLQLIYHEYIVDYEKSYQVSDKLLELNSLNTSYIINHIEAALTSGRFKTARQESEKILVSDSLGTIPLDNETRLATRFCLIAAYVLQGDILDAFSEYGTFKREYRKKEKREEGRWLWSGTKKFLNDYENINFTHRDLLLDMINALESNRAEGLPILEEVEVAWKSIIRG